MGMPNCCANSLKAPAASPCLGQRARHDFAQALPVAGYRELALAPKRERRGLHILGQIDHDRTGAPGARDLEGRAHRGLQALRIGDQKHMFGDRAHQ